MARAFHPWLRPLAPEGAGRVVPSAFASSEEARPWRNEDLHLGGQAQGMRRAEMTPHKVVQSVACTAGVWLPLFVSLSAHRKLIRKMTAFSGGKGGGGGRAKIAGSCRHSLLWRGFIESWSGASSHYRLPSFRIQRSLSRKERDRATRISTKLMDGRGLVVESLMVVSFQKM